MKKKEKERIEKMKIDRYKRCWDELELLQYNIAKWQAHFTGVLSIYESKSLWVNESWVDESIS